MADDRDDARPDPAALRAGYEQLRECVLAGRGDGWRLGHAVLARRGMAGWIAAQTTVAPMAPAAAAREAAADGGQIVAVLSQMALALAA